MHPQDRTVDLYGLRTGHQQVSICALALHRRFPAEWAAWLKKYLKAVSAFRDARMNERLSA